MYYLIYCLSIRELKKPSTVSKAMAKNTKETSSQFELRKKAGIVCGTFTELSGYTRQYLLHCTFDLIFN